MSIYRKGAAPEPIVKPEPVDAIEQMLLLFAEIHADDPVRGPEARARLEWHQKHDRPRYAQYIKREPE